MRDMVNRARRYPVHIPLRYRPVGKGKWREGKTDNFGRTGVLFRTNELLRPHAQVEMTFHLPPLIVGKPAARVVCEGRILRLADSDDPECQFSYAVAIKKYKIVRGQHLLPRQASSPKRGARKART